MKTISPDERGFAHYVQMVIALVIVVGIAFIGVKIINGSKAASLPCHSQTISTSKNSRGTCVKEIQIRLNSVRNTIHTSKLSVDGVYGPLTRNAVVAFQKHYKLVSSNGVVTPSTWTALTARTTTVSSTGISSTSATNVSPAANKIKVKTLVSQPGFTLQACNLAETSGSGSSQTYKMVGFIAHDPKSSSVITAEPASPEILKLSRGQYAYATGLDFAASHTYYYFPYGNLAAPNVRYGFMLGALPKCR